ncbi:MAG: hypothetical protein FJ144_13795 [Deltaproteobacteria bacterium]|nr:hypothetical protein [Deltaproteobacteria bacterium]
MLILLPVLLLAYFLWHGGSALGIGLIAAGLLVELALTLRLLRATVGGVGGHAEWVRDVSKRPRLQRSPAWLLATALVLAGAAIAAWG